MPQLFLWKINVRFKIMANARFRPSYLALSISLISGSALAADYTINNAQTATNGGNTLNGSDGLTITSSGSISTNGADGVSFTGNDNQITIDGDVTTSGNIMYAVIGWNNDNTIAIAGSLTTSGNLGHALGLNGDGNIANVSGRITTTGSQAHGIVNFSGAENNYIRFTGSVLTSGADSFGFANAGDSNVAVISGLVTSSGERGRGISNGANDSVYVIDGTIAATHAAGSAIYNISGTGNTYTFSEGSRIVGDIFLRDAGGTTGNTLKFDVGSALSYVYDTTGSWTLEDLDGRSVVSGSAMAAGIGNAETADELQYLRLSQINHSLLNRADRYALVDGERQAWADPFYFNSERDASSTDATIEDYDADGYGLTVGLPIVLKGLDADVILGVQETALDIHSGTQNIDVTSLRAGLYFPNLLTRDAIRVSGKALIGYNQHDMDRQVLVNSNTTTGITTYTADYDSWEAVAGLEAEHSQPLGTGATMLTASLGADLVYEAIESYDETANFHWDSRDLLQGVAKASIGLHHVHTNGMKTYAIASVQARDVLDGKTTDYAINGTAVNFSGGDFNDTITQLNLGATYQAKDNLQLGLNLQAARSDNDIDSYAASARLNWTF
jgi:hypothetical protein